MAEEIIELLTGEGISVRKADGSFQAISGPDGFTAKAFRNAVAAFDAAYRLDGVLPTVERVYKFWPKMAKDAYAKLFLTPEFKEALRYRGVEWEPDSGLSTEQTFALLALTNWTDRRSTTIKLKDLGISMAKHQAWMRQPLYSESYRERTESSFKDAAPMALNRLMGNAEAGDFQSIKLILEATGRWNPNQNAVEDARIVVQALAEAVIAEVTDPEVRRRIDSRMRLIAGSLTLNDKPQALEP